MTVVSRSLPNASATRPTISEEEFFEVTGASVHALSTGLLQRSVDCIYKNYASRLSMEYIRSCRADTALGKRSLAL